MTAAVVPGGLPLRLRTGAFTRAAASGEPCASTDPACQRATIIERAGLRRATPSTFASAWAWGLLRVAMHGPQQWGKARAHTTRQGSIVNAECGAAMIVRSEGGGWVGGHTYRRCRKSVHGGSRGRGVIAAPTVALVCPVPARCLRAKVARLWLGREVFVGTDGSCCLASVRLWFWLGRKTCTIRAFLYGRVLAANWGPPHQVVCARHQRDVISVLVAKLFAKKFLWLIAAITVQQWPVRPISMAGHKLTHLLIRELVPLL